MKIARFLLLLTVALCPLLNPRTHAAELTGTVHAVSGNTVAVTIADDLSPNVGDKALIFFKLAEGDDEISVATGSVVKVEADSVQLKIEKATGDVAKDQLVRITSANPQKRDAPDARSSAASNAGNASLASSSSQPRVAGRWTGVLSGEPITLVLRDDGAAILALPPMAGYRLTLGGHYVVDYAARPPRLEFTPAELIRPADLTEEETKQYNDQLNNSDAVTYLNQTIYLGEFEGDSRLRLEAFQKTQRAASPKLSPDAVLLSRVSPGTAEKDAAAVSRPSTRQTP